MFSVCIFVSKWTLKSAMVPSTTHPTVEVAKTYCWLFAAIFHHTTHWLLVGWSEVAMKTVGVQAHISPFCKRQWLARKHSWSPVIGCSAGFGNNVTLHCVPLHIKTLNKVDEQSPFFGCGRKPTKLRKKLHCCFCVILFCSCLISGKQHGDENRWQLDWSRGAGLVAVHTVRLVWFQCGCTGLVLQV